MIYWKQLLSKRTYLSFKIGYCIMFSIISRFVKLVTHFFSIFSFFQRFHYFFLIRFCTKSLALKKHKQYIHESKSIILSSIYRHRFSHTQVGVRLVGVGVAAQSRGAYRPTVLFWPCLAHYWLLPFPPLESLVPPPPVAPSPSPYPYVLPLFVPVKCHSVFTVWVWSISF